MAEANVLVPLLTVEEVWRLAEHEAIIERGLQTFYAVGTALATIRDARLYRVDYATFEDYCRERWGLKRQRAYELMEAAAAAHSVSEISDIRPERESHVVPLLTVKDPQQQAAIYQEAVATAPNGKLTAAHVAHTVERLTAPAMAVHYSSETPEWYTPKKVIDAVIDFFDEIDLDPCSNSHESPNVPARQHYTQADDGLAQAWWGRVYLNPPYGDEIGRWIEKMLACERDRSIEACIALLPARPGSAWFELLADCALCFIRGRLTFVGAESGAPFPSVLAYTGDEWARFAASVGHLGNVWRRMP